jgi:flagellar basal-body rod protein FlgC
MLFECGAMVLERASPWRDTSPMSAILPISLSGLAASVRRVDAVAANIANARSAGTPSPDGGSRATAAYQPVDVVQSPAAGGGTVATYRPIVPATRPSYEPDSPAADADGIVAEPNVDVPTQMTDLLAARRSYQANLKVIEAAGRMQDEALRIVV